MAEIQKVSYTHEAIAEWLVVNPASSQGECARFFGYSEAWLSQIIHSDAFQAYYRKLAEDRGMIAVHGIAEKINAVAAIGLERLQERMLLAPDDRLLVDGTEMALKALGYIGGGKQAVSVPQQHMHVHVDAEALTEARERAAQRFSGLPLDVAPATS